MPCEMQIEMRKEIRGEGEMRNTLHHRKMQIELRKIQHGITSTNMEGATTMNTESASSL